MRVGESWLALAVSLGMSSTMGCHGGRVAEPPADADATGSDATEVAPEVADGGCATDIPAEHRCAPRKGGPDMVKVEGYCIDSTEVTNAQYQAFLKSIPPTGGYSPSKPKGCEWKSSWVPNEAMSALDEPVSGVDWCDAYAFCQWAGKRLCGKIGTGGPLVPGETGFLDSALSEWVHACSNGGKTLFPYAGGFDPTRCNGAAAAKAGVWPVRSFCECRGVDAPFSYIFDMSGNVYEWVNACGADYCHIAGGAFTNDEASLRCRVADYGKLPERKPAHGIRCCADAP